jgi:hypothetical protein
MAEVAGACAKDVRGSSDIAGKAAMPISSLRRNGECKPGFFSSDISTPLVRVRLLVRQALLNLCGARIREIAYTAPQNADVGFCITQTCVV